LVRGDKEADRFADIDAVIIDPIFEAMIPSGSLGSRARQAPGIIDDFPAYKDYGLHTVAPYQFQE
jgi:hypothetical protein